MKTTLAIVTLSLCTTQAMAQVTVIPPQPPASQLPPVPPDLTPMPPTNATAAASIAGGPTITWQKFCQELATYQPSADVAYKPATDVHGRAVVPADLPQAAGAQPLNLPTSYRILITTNQAQQMNLMIPNVPLNADAFIGQVVVNGDGSVSFNGQPVSNNQVYGLCSNL